MRHAFTRSLCATAAISAVLAFGSTPLLAQEAAPTIVLPPTASAPPAAAPAAAAPTIVLPPAPTPQAAAPEAAPPQPAPAPRAERSAARTAQRAAAPAPSMQAAPVAAAPAAPAESGPSVFTPPVDAVPVTPPEAPVVAAPEPQRDSVPSSVDIPDELIAAVGVGILGLGIAGIMAMRSRRRRAEVLYEDAYEPQAVAEAPATSIPDELALTRSHELRDPAPAQAFALPAGEVPTGDERQELLDRMVAAAPDSENPFTSAKARRKRARIILQAREHRQSAEPFDWRTYRSPTARETTPPLVDA